MAKQGEEQDASEAPQDVDGVRENPTWRPFQIASDDLSERDKYHRIQNEQRHSDGNRRSQG